MPTIAEATAALTAPGQMFEMEGVVINGVPLRVWKHAPATLRVVLEHSRAHGELDFLVYDGDAPGAQPGRFDRLTFDTHFRAAATLAHRLRDTFGVRSGDRVAIAIRNLPEWSIAFWAATSAGAIVVPLNAWWTGPELRYGLADSGSIIAVVDGQRAGRIAEHLDALPDVRHLLVARSPDGDRPSIAVDFDDALGDLALDAEQPDVALVPEDDATIFYTSGTTGHPKGALGTHRNICTNLFSLVFAQARAAARRDPVAPAAPAGRNVSLLSVPFFHATGCHWVLVANLAFGGEIVLMHRWDAGRALELIEREGVTNFGGVPAMVWQVLEHPDFARRDTMSIRSVAYGGAPAAPELVRRIESMFPGRTPSNGYGLTETSPLLTFNRTRAEWDGLDAAERSHRLSQAGAPAIGVRVQVDERGEVLARSNHVFEGYWGQPEESAKALANGWFHTGDGGHLEDGYLVISDRKKDVIITGGENVSSIEVEDCLFQHPAVAEAAVIGVPDE